MSEVVDLILFIFSLVAGTIFLLLGRRQGQSWLEAFKPTALLFGLSGFAGGQYFLAGVAEVVVSLGCVVPGIAISVQYSRQLMAQRATALLPSPGAELGGKGELAVAQANRSDLLESRRGLSRRLMGVGAVAALPVVGVGVASGSWSTVLIGGALAFAMGLFGRFITRPVKDHAESGSDREIAPSSEPFAVRDVSEQ